MYVPYLEGMPTIAVRAEPTGIEVQRYFGMLDPVVQTILTDENADRRGLLDAPNQQIQSELLDQA